MRRGTVVIPVNRLAEGEGRALVKLPFLFFFSCSAALSSPGRTCRSLGHFNLEPDFSDAPPSNDSSPSDNPQLFFSHDKLPPSSTHALLSSYFYIHVFSMSNKALKTTDHFLSLLLPLSLLFFFFCLD